MLQTCINSSSQDLCIVGSIIQVFQKLQDFQQGDKDTAVRYAIFNLKVVLLRFKVTGTLSPLDPPWCKNAFQLDLD